MYLVKLLHGVIINFQAVSAGSTVLLDKETADKLAKRNLIEILEEKEGAEEAKNVVLTQGELEQLKHASITKNDNVIAEAKKAEKAKAEEEAKAKVPEEPTNDDGETRDEVVKGYMQLKLEELQEAATEAGIDAKGLTKKLDYANALADLEF